jgi:hypothetical protein
MFEPFEAMIVERLKQKLPGVTIATLDDVTRVPELRQKAPLVAVIYDGYEVIEDQAQGMVVNIEQTWWVVCAAKTARGAGLPIDARNEAGGIGQQVLRALLGFRVAPARTLRLAEAPGPEYDGGFCYMPLAFSVRATFKGDPD